MHLLLIALFAVALTFGIKRAWDLATDAGRSRVDAARTRLTDWRAARANRPMPPPSPVLIRAGAVLGGAAAAVGLAWDAGWPGLRLGWALGRDRVRQWWLRRQQPPVEAPPEPEPPANEPDDHADGDETPEPTSPPNLRLVTNEPESEGAAVQPVSTMSTTEVGTVAELRAEAAATMAAAAAEMEDAAAEAARRLQILKRRRYLAEVAPSIIDRDRRGQGALAALVEPAQRAYDAALERLAACESEHALAGAALNALNAHRPMEEATAATPQASTRTETYQPQ